MSGENGLFLIFWRFQTQIVLKLFLFPDIFKQWISCPEQYMQSDTKKYVFVIVSSSEKHWNCQYSVRERDELAYHSSSARWPS